MFSCQFLKIFKSTFFIEHLRWLPLPILKPLDSQRQLCKWVSKLVAIYFISTFLVLVSIFVFILGACTRIPFFISRALWLRKYEAFDFSDEHTIEVSRDFLGRAPSSWFSTLPSFGAHGPCECGDKTFLICHVTRDRCITWLFGWGSLILSHRTAKFRVHRLCESGNITFFIYHLTVISNCHAILWVGSPHPKSPTG